MLTKQQAKDLRELVRLHDEAFRDYQERHNFGSKSSEGCVSLNFGNFWDREGWDSPGNLGEPEVEVYSYALGPNRNHYFDSIAEALTEVRKWHQEQMNRPEEEEW